MQFSSWQDSIPFFPGSLAWFGGLALQITSLYCIRRRWFDVRPHFHLLYNHLRHVCSPPQIEHDAHHGSAVSILTPTPLQASSLVLRDVLCLQLFYKVHVIGFVVILIFSCIHCESMPECY